MTDPAKEIAELRQALSGRTVSCGQCNALATENQTLRDAIREAQDALQEAHERTHPDKQNGQSMFHVYYKAKKALAKLQPFLK